MLWAEAFGGFEAAGCTARDSTVGVVLVLCFRAGTRFAHALPTAYAGLHLEGGGGGGKKAGTLHVVLFWGVAIW